MALGQVGARTEGDYYQGLFFWWQAAQLFSERSRVSRVVFEHDEADGVDDVAVFYAPPGVEAGGWYCTADYFQVKHHVDHRGTYSGEVLMEPSSKVAKSSLLQRFANANERLVKDGQTAFRLHLVSNWDWDPKCPLRKLITSDGALRDEFFTAGPRSAVGKIRDAWRKHLKMESKEGEFVSFARRLRFMTNFLGRSSFRQWVLERLQLAGLVTPPADRSACPYDSLMVQFLMNEINSFDQAAMRELCEREGLVQSDPSGREYTAVGVRSFLRFAENMEDSSDEFICVAAHFEGRHPRTPSSWRDAAASVVRYFGDPDRRRRLREAPGALALECHGSIAALVGYELSANSGVAVFPLQKGDAGPALWRPEAVDVPGPDQPWSEGELTAPAGEGALVVILSVTHDAGRDVLDFLGTGAIGPVRRAINFVPDGGAGRKAVLSPTHATRLAEQLVERLRALRLSRTEPVHLFFAAPNALMFAIGRHREALGRLQLYEFDFDLSANGSYAASFTLPLS